MFLDETPGVTSKARKSSLNKSTSSTSTSTTPPIPAWEQFDLKKSLSAGDTPRSLSPSLEAQSTAFFFEHFAIDENLSSQYQTYATSITEASPGLQALHHSIRALGLAGLSRFEGASHLTRLSESQYLDAIRAMNTALQDPDTAKKDYTLLAVMILTAFETVAGGDGNNTLAAWSNHVKGAAALLAARGTEQFQTDDGVRMFIQAAIPVIVSCISQGIRVDETIMRLSQDAKQFADQSDPAWQMFEHKLLFADFYGQVKQKIITDPLLVLQRAAELEELGRTVTATLQEPSPWTYQTVQTDEPSDMVPLGYYHVYSYFFCAEMWNGVRAIRIVLNQMIRSFLLLGFAARPPLFTDQAYTLMFQHATDSLFTLQNGVIASVPQYLGYKARRTSSSMDFSSGKGKAPASQPPTRTPTPTGTSFGEPLSASPVSTQQPQFLWSNFPQKRYQIPLLSPASSASMTPLPIIRAGGGAHLPWLLFLLGTTDITTSKLRAWSIDRLRTVGTEMRIQQALSLAEKLEDGSYVEMEGWWRNIWEGLLVVGSAGEGGGGGAEVI